jgi:hypothetical protein
MLRCKTDSAKVHEPGGPVSSDEDNNAARCGAKSTQVVGYAKGDAVAATKSATVRAGFTVSARKLLQQGAIISPQSFCLVGPFCCIDACIGHSAAD